MPLQLLFRGSSLCGMTNLCTVFGIIFASSHITMSCNMFFLDRCQVTRSLRDHCYVQRLEILLLLYGLPPHNSHERDERGARGRARLLAPRTRARCSGKHSRAISGALN